MREIARLLLPALRWDSRPDVAAARVAVERAVDAGVGGFVLDGMPTQAAAQLTEFARARADEALLFVVDPATLATRAVPEAQVSIPPLAALAALRDTNAVRRTARAVARAVRRSGCNAMLAPSCDVARTPTTESFGANASAVALADVEWIDAAQAEGVLCLAGSFPGEGHADFGIDALPVVRDAEDALYATDLVPFRAAIDAGIAGIVMASASYPALDRSGTPAALSSEIVTRVLRGELAFDGLVTADSALLDARTGRAVPACEIVAAGVDLVLRTTRLDVELRALLDAVDGGRLDRERVHDAARRRRERAELAGAPAPPASRDDPDAPWLDELAERTIVVIRGRAVRIRTPVELLVVSDGPADKSSIASSFRDGLARAGGDPDSVRQIAAPSATRSVLVIVAVPSSRRLAAGSPSSQGLRDRLASVCADARTSRRDAALIWCGHPDAVPPAIDTDLVIACWSASPAMIAAAGRWMVRRV